MHTYLNGYGIKPSLSDFCQGFTDFPRIDPLILPSRFFRIQIMNFNIAHFFLFSVVLVDRARIIACCARIIAWCARIFACCALVVIICLLSTYCYLDVWPNSSLLPVVSPPLISCLHVFQFLLMQIWRECLPAWRAWCHIVISHQCNICVKPFICPQLFQTVVAVDIVVSSLFVPLHHRLYHGSPSLPSSLS